MTFASVQDIEHFLQLAIATDAAKRASAERALTEATAGIRWYCRQYISLVTDDEIILDSHGGTRIYLPELPVVSVSSVVEDDETLTEGEDYKLGQFGILHRLGQEWSIGIQNITITYSHGYDVDDPGLQIAKDIATRAAARAFQAGLKAAENEGILGVQSKSLGDFSVTYSAETGGGVGEGVMGASAARMLLMSEKDMLNFYRSKGP
jgi:hypothetical protein